MRTLPGIRPRSLNDLEAIQQWRQQQEIDRGPASAQTRNHYLRAVKQFSRWLKWNGRTREDRLAHLSMWNVRTDRRYDRRALSADDFARLIESAESGPTGETIAGPDRAMMYVLSAWTGYRWMPKLQRPGWPGRTRSHCCPGPW